MTHTFLGLVGALTVLMYWSYCRRSAVTHQKRLADLVAAYLKSDASTADKDCAYFFYRASRVWLYLPLMTVLVPFVLLCNLLVGEPKRKKENTENDQMQTSIIDASVKMYMVKNPITSAVFMTITAIMIGVFMPLAIVFKRLRAVPSATDVYSSIAYSATHGQLKRHPH